MAKQPGLMVSLGASLGNNLGLELTGFNGKTTGFIGQPVKMATLLITELVWRRAYDLMMHGLGRAICKQT